VQPECSILVDVVEMHDGNDHVSVGMVVTNLSFRSGGLIVYRSTPQTGNLREAVAGVAWSTDYGEGNSLTNALAHFQEDVTVRVVFCSFRAPLDFLEGW
jgi:hypothetical protein